ncbi:MAG TPA: hypothetical protein QF753_12455 [Victivallales bacterium]|nr:hypothetical protein [Victivallales bacterium]
MHYYSTFEIASIVVVTIIIVILKICFLLSLYKSLQLAGHKNRRMTPGLVWLNLIPVFNLFWLFYTCAKVAEAIKNKLDKKGRDGAWKVGLAYCILIWLSFIPYIGIFFTVLCIIMWLFYWTKIAAYNKLMISEEI